MQSFAVFLLALATTAYGASSNERIVGGVDAEAGVYPYQVSLRTWSGHFCGGSIISPRYILTAAHCVTGYTLYPNFVRVEMGTTTTNSGGTTITGRRIRIHPNFNAREYSNDIALVYLSSSITYNDRIQPIALPTEDFTKPNYPATLTGWGMLSFPGTVSRNLQEITLTIMDQQDCLDSDSRISGSNICTIAPAGQGACRGDSGGPLVADGVQVGVVSWGSPCALGRPDVYARVWSYVDWIKQTSGI